jgi:hypothetical protein
MSDFGPRGATRTATTCLDPDHRDNLPSMSRDMIVCLVHLKQICFYPLIVKTGTRVGQVMDSVYPDPRTIDLIIRQTG